MKVEVDLLAGCLGSNRILGRATVPPPVRVSCGGLQAQ
jgi:hypothetical protein